MIELTAEHFNEHGVFINEFYFNQDTQIYVFQEDVTIKVPTAIFEKSIYVEGYQEVEGNQIVKGDQIVKGYQIVEGYQTVERDQIVEGNQVISNKILKRNILDINHIGSRSSLTQIYFTQQEGIWIRCGCFFDSIDIFEKQVLKTHNDNKYAKEYGALIEFAKKMERLGE